MSIEPQATPDSSADFLRSTLAVVETRGRNFRLRLIGVRILAICVALWFAFGTGHAATLLDVECTVLIVVAAMLAVCTERIRSTANDNTRSVLQAVEDLRLRLRN